jgi:arsenate reductase
MVDGRRYCDPPERRQRAGADLPGPTTRPDLRRRRGWAHFNPVVTLAAWWTGRSDGAGPSLREVAAYVPTQVAGAIGGAVLADAMFAEPLVRFSTHDRSAPHLWLGEVVATAGLILLVFGLARTGRAHVAPVTVAPTSRPRKRPAVSSPAVPSVLFVCVHNAGRSQMAAACLTHLGGERVQVRSAGSAPADAVNSAVVAAMSEVGIDISAEKPKVLTVEAVRTSDVVITMGCGDACPVFSGKRYLDWSLADPAGRAWRLSGRSGTRSSGASATRSPNSASKRRYDQRSSTRRTSAWLRPRSRKVATSSNRAGPAGS